MAPNGPKNGGSRGARNQPAGNNKSTRGGGITKRRSNGATKIDRDGDLDMDAPAGGKGAGNRGGKNKNKSDNSAAPSEPSGRSTRTSTSNRPPKPTTKAQQMIAKVISNGSGSLSSRISQGIDTSSRHNRPVNGANLMTLKVQGLQNSRAKQNVGGGRQELVEFLQRKATTVGRLTRPARIKKSQLDGDFVYVTANKEDGEAILKLDGFDFAGTQINITEQEQPEPGLSTGAQDTKNKLKEMLSRRYNVETKLLDLSTLGNDPSSAGSMFQEATPQKLFRALMVICDEQFKTAQAKREAIVSVSLAGNNIGDVVQVMSLVETFPDLINLDLSNNQIKDLRGLRKWQHRLRRVETLLLNNNPIESADPTWKNEVTTWYPKLQNLSGIQVRTAAEVSAAELASKPKPIPQRGADFRDINRIGELFITEFIAGYDTDRAGLAAKYYDEQSTFSLSVNTSSPHAPDIPLPQWNSYIRISRNHQKITTSSARWQRLFKGTGLIQGAWQNLPPTQHPNLAAQFDKYIIDCHPINGLPDPSGQSAAGVDGMAMTIHGEFEDQDPTSKVTAKRSFSRTFILGPGIPDRNPIRVISDMLALKAYIPVPTATGAVPGGAGAAPAVAPTPALDEEAQKQQMILELCKQTGMVPDYSKMCLDVAGWVFEQALITFNEKRAQLPAEAFASAPL